jgi:uncharacterized SAM-binding protein YcdF (DUF218 family)
MFFVLSKVLAFLLKPLNLMVGAALYGLFTKNQFRKRRAFTVLIIMLLVFTNPWLANELARRWETGERSPSGITEPYEVGILLGGYTDMPTVGAPGVLSFTRSVNRLTGALALYQTGKIRRILLSGGSGRLVGRENNESAVVREYLLQIGVPDSVIWVEGRSRNTWENALYSKEIVDARAPGARCLLITSAWHMRRAEACFEKVGLHCDAFGTDFFVEKDLGNKLHWVQPTWRALMKWDFLLKEWVGWGVYKLKGYN